MAVSMSAGGSGYMRSDFMISDAAIPLRVEESMEKSDAGQFSKVLSGIGEAKQAVSEAVTAENSSAPVNVPKEIPQDFHQLAEAVANGEIKLEDIPEELLTQGMLKELTKLLGKAETPETNEDIPDGSNDPAAQELMAELAAMFNVQQPTVVADDKTDELSALTVQPVTETVQPVEVRKEIEPVAEGLVQKTQFGQQTADEADDVLFAQEVPQNTVEPETPVEVAEIGTADELAEVAVHAEPVVNTDTSAKEKPEQNVQPVRAEEATQSAAVRQITPQQSGSADKQDEASADGRQQSDVPVRSVSQGEARPEESFEVSEELSKAQVSVTRKEPEAAEAPKAAVQAPKSAVQAPERSAKEPEEVQTEQPEQSIFPQQHAQRSRVVSKSDEFQMIKNSADSKQPVENAAQNLVQPQTVNAERPVMIPRTDGSSVTVKPSDVAQQVAEKLTESTENLNGDVEYSVTLNPEELGRITVRMTKTADGTVSVSIAAENSRTLKIIEDNGTAIQDTLKQNGVQLESWQIVSESRQETHAEDYQGSSRNPYRESENEQQEQQPDGESFAEIIASM
ncbi:MAG: flagellar hook-length control protein FliK [Oscillospiraceae bacterium]